MPVRRPPSEIWAVLRKIAWRRAKKKCAHCAAVLTLKEVHLDHVDLCGTNAIRNLLPLCRRCYTLRLCPGRQGLVAQALADGVIPYNWREHVWE
jgi:hypothetical protein